MKMHKFVVLSTLAVAVSAVAGVQSSNVPEPPRKDAKQQELKEWFLENYYGPGVHAFLPYDFALFLDFCEGRLFEKGKDAPQRTYRLTAKGRRALT